MTCESTRPMPLKRNNPHSSSRDDPKRRSTPSNSVRDNAPTPDFTSTNPYEILGVSNTATSQQIKSQYKKLALKYHPDRVVSADKEEANKNFAAISGAFELLGDASRRREFDERISPQTGSRRGHDFSDDRGGFHDPFNDPFFSSSFGFGGRSSSRESIFHFTDPFQIFEEVFRDELRSQRHSSSSSSRRGAGPFSDPFFQSDPFSSDPFVSSGSMFGCRTGGMSSSHFGAMDSMMSRMSQMQNQSMRGFDTLGNGGSSVNFATSSSSFSTGGNHPSVSQSTKTTIVNGVRKTVTERTVVHPDGRIERHVESSDGDDSAGRLPSSIDHPALESQNCRRNSRR